MGPTFAESDTGVVRGASASGRCENARRANDHGDHLQDQNCNGTTRRVRQDKAPALIGEVNNSSRAYLGPFRGRTSNVRRATKSTSFASSLTNIRLSSVSWLMCPAVESVSNFSLSGTAANYWARNRFSRCHRRHPVLGKERAGEMILWPWRLAMWLAALRSFTSQSRPRSSPSPSIPVTP